MYAMVSPMLPTFLNSLGLQSYKSSTDFIPVKIRELEPEEIGDLLRLWAQLVSLNLGMAARLSASSAAVVQCA